MRKKNKISIVTIMFICIALIAANLMASTPEEKEQKRASLKLGLFTKICG